MPKRSLIEIAAVSRDANEVVTIMKEMVRINNLGNKATKADNFLVARLREILDNDSTFFEDGFTELGIASLKELRETAAIMRSHE